MTIPSMESSSLSIVLSSLSSSPPLFNHTKLSKRTSVSSIHPPKTHLSLFKTVSKLTIIDLATSLPSSALDSPNKIDVEATLISIDDFLTRNPFFVYGCLFIWLVAIPVAQDFFSKYKYVSAIDAFRKLRDDQNAQLLDIRESKSWKAMRSPNLKILNKVVVHVEFNEDDEDGFVKRVLENFEDPENTVFCVLDNFDGNSLKVAELLFKNGFKEAYAIKDGIRGEKGWLAIQETLLPPSVHMYPRKKKKKKVKISEQVGMNGAVSQQAENNSEGSSSNNLGESKSLDDATVDKSMASTSPIKISSRSSSPYPNYPDLKPPSSPTPSKP